MQARPDKSLILDPNEFYILASKQDVQVGIGSNYQAQSLKLSKHFKA
jgi:deoxycytidine triphosphate deaminase